MAMRIAPVPYFWAEVKFSMIGDLGQSVEVSLKIKYKRLEQQEYEQLLKRVQAARLAAITAVSKALAKTPAAEGGEEAPAQPAAEAPEEFDDQKLVAEVVLDWDDVLGDDEQKLPFTRDNLARALKALGCRAAIARRFMELHQEEQEKNFAPRPAITSGT